jgi:hypothetical protein
MVFPGKVYSVNIFHRARPSIVRVIAHPGDDELDMEHVAFLLRYKLFAAHAEADLHSMAESRFSSKIHFELAAYSLPRCLAESPFLQPPGRNQIPLTFPDGPPRLHYVSYTGACCSSVSKAPSPAGAQALPYLCAGWSFRLEMSLPPADTVGPLL